MPNFYSASLANNPTLDTSEGSPQLAIIEGLIAAGKSITYDSNVDNVAPGEVVGLDTAIGRNSIGFVWELPDSATVYGYDVTGVTIKRGTDSCPESVSEGDLVLDNELVESYTDSGLSEETQYCYSVFTKDDADNYSVATQVTQTTSTFLTATQQESFMVTEEMPLILSEEAMPSYNLIIAQEGTALEVQAESISISELTIDENFTLDICGTCLVSIDYLTANNDSGVVLVKGGAISFTESQGDIVLDNAALSLENTTGTIDIMGDLEVDANSSVSIRTGQIVSAELITLNGGTLEVLTDDDNDGVFSLGRSKNKVIQLFNADNIQGQFEHVKLPQPEPGMMWDTSKLYTEGIIVMTLSSPEKPEDVVLVGDLLVFPSPVKQSESFQVGFKVPYSVTVKLYIYDMLGQLHAETHVQTVGNTYSKTILHPTQFSLGNSASGVYIIVATYEGRIIGKQTFGITP